MSTPLEALSRSLADAVARAGRSTVAIHARRRIPASGVLWRPGIVVATHHTVHRDDDVPVTLPDGTRARATVAGRDPGTDLVVLRLADGPPHAGAEPATVDRTALAVGRLVLAVGRPGDAVTAAFGVVSAVGPAWRSWQGGQLDQFVRLDLAVYDGFSGGPLVDAAGHVLGVNTSALARGGALTIPAATVDRVADQLLAGGRVRRGWLGIATQPVRLPEGWQARLGDAAPAQPTALLLVGVEPGSPAERGGLLLGDLLVAIADRPTADVDDVLAALGPDTVGRTLPVRLLRGGELRTVEVTVGEPPTREPGR